jgi:hypothetical protein
MKILSRLVLLLIVTALTACEKGNIPVINESHDLLGFWINPVITDTIWQYERSVSFKEDVPGICFKSGNEFVERKNAGWCGTPPVFYANYEGNWNRNESILNISVGYWGGTVDYEWKIISVDNNKLMIYRVKDTYHYLE